MSYQKDPLYQQFLAEEQAKDTPQVQSQPKQQAYEQDPLYQKFLGEEKEKEFQKKLPSKEKFTNMLNDFSAGSNSNFYEYGASINKVLDTVSDFVTQRDTKFFEDNQKFLNKKKEEEKKKATNKGMYETGMFVADPLNLTPAGIISKGTKAVRVVKSITSGAGIGAGTMAFKNYGDDTKTQNEKNTEMGIGAGFVAGINGIIAGITKGKVTNAIDPDLFVNKPSHEVVNAIMGNPKDFGLSENEAQQVVSEVQKTYPKVPDEFKVEQAGFPQKPQEPNFRQVPQYPPMSKEQALSILAKEADKKRVKQGLQPIYSVDPKYATERIYPQKPQDTYQPNFVSGDVNKNMPTPYNEAGNLEARYQKVASHPRLQELLQARENVLAKDSVSPTRNTDNGYFAHENNGNGYETTKIPPNRERNYNSDFQLTKQDIYKLYTGKVDDDLLSKLETDLGTLDNHPDYAKSFNSESGIDYKSEMDKLDNSDVKMSDDDWDEANSIFSKGIDNVAVATYAGVDEDENGNITFDPEKFVLGLGGYTAVKQALKNGKVQGVLKDYAQQAIEKVDFNPEVQKRGNGFNSMFVGAKGNEKGSFSDVATKKTMREIDDSGAKLIDGGLNSKIVDIQGRKTSYREANLGDVLEHNELFKNYPNAKDIQVVESSVPMASYQPAHKGKIIDSPPYILLNKRFMNGNSITPSGLKVLLHEVQHHIQNTENWAKGASVENMKGTDLINPKYTEAKGKRKKEIIAEIDNMLANPDYKFQLDSSNKDFDEYSKKIDNLENEINKLSVRSANKEESRIKRNKIEQLSNEIDNVFSDFKKYSNEKYPYLGMLDKLESEKYSLPEKYLSKHEAYMRHWGEQQARATEERRNFTPGQRQGEDWTKTLERTEGEYKEPIIRYDNGVAEMSPVKSKTQKEKRGIYNVTYNGKNSTEVRKADSDELIRYAKGNKNQGALHIQKHLGDGTTGEVSKEELLNIGEVIRKGKVYENHGKNVYELEKDGVRFRAITGVGKNDNEKVITFYSDRNLEEKKGYEISLITNNSSSDKAIIPQKDLIIQHNLTNRNLHHADKNGGLAVPSLAITKKDNPIDGFGDITMLGDEELAKPKRDHKVFGADIYSPRYPRIKKDLKIADQKRIEKDLTQYNERLGKDSDYLDFDNLSDSVAMRMKFLEEKGVNPKIIFEKPNEKDITLYNKFKDLLKDGLTNREYSQNDDFMNRFKEHLGYEKAKDFSSSELQRVARNFAGSLKQIKSKLENSDTPDFYTSRSEISKQVSDFGDEYENYVNDYLSKNGAVEKIYNGTDNQGRQRWQAHTLNNVIKKLKKNLRGGENFNYGTGSMRAKLTPEFKTLKKIRDEKDRLVSKDDFTKVKDEVEKKVDELSENLKEYYDYDTNDFSYLEQVMSAIADQDLAGYGFKNIPKNVKDEFDNLTTALKEMPTEYFESKVLRAMDIGEFSHAVIPKNASKETRDILEKKGIEVTEYDPNLPNDRVAKIKQTAERNGYLFANAGHNMAGGFAGGADSLINQRDYNQDGEYDYKDLLAGVVAGTISINALKKMAPKLFEEGADTGGFKAGLFAGSKAKGFDAKAQAGKTFDGKYDTLERFEIDDSKATIKATAKELNKAKNERLSQEKNAIVEQYESGAITIDEAKKLADDILNKYNHTNSGTFRLDDVLDHKELFDNYPKASEMKVTFTDMPKGANGYFDNQANEIVLNTNMSNDEIKSSLLHELQHSIQKKEGFARGGSAQEFYNDAKKKIDLLKYELEFEPDEFIQDKMMAKLQKLEDTYDTKGKEVAFDMYQKLAGEIEARDVQARADYTAKQREEIAPYSSENIAQEDANVRFNNADDSLFKNMSESKQAFKDKAKKAKAKGYEHIINLVDKETKKEWGDATSTLKRLFFDTLGAKYHELRENATSSTNGMSVKLERLHNVLSELSDTDKVSMHNYIVGEESNIPDSLKPLADNIKKSIDDLSKQLVDLGVLSKEQYDEWAGHYIHRNYEKHFFQDVKGLMKKGFKIDEIHKRGKIEEISATQANKLLLNPSFLNSTKKAMKDGGQRLRKLANGKYELRRDWTKEEREAMGEITDISISAPDTLMRLKRMADNANFMKNIEGIDDVVLKDTGNFSDEEISAQGFAKVPNNPKYGVLAGKTIRKDVLDDLSARNDELFNTFHGSDGALGRIWKNYLSLWKKSKTVWNAPSHINNFMSNTFLMHLSGMRANEVVTSIGRAGKMMVQGNKYEELLKKQMLGRATKSELSKLAEMGEDLKYFIEAKDGGLLGRSQLNDILQGNQKQVRTTALGKLDKFTEDAYHNGDAINRIAMYSHLRSKLDMSEDEARKAVLTIMPDYSKPMPKAYRVLRDTGISPFIAWSYYTMPAVRKMLGTKQGAKKATLAMGTLAGLEYALTGGDVNPTDNIPFMNTNKPEDFKGRRFGVSSKNGKVTTIKTDRWIPYVELLNPINFLISNVSGVTSNAVVNTLTANSAGGMINPYYGRPITYKNKKTSDKAYDYLKYLSKSYVPFPAQAYSGWDMIDSLARSTKKRKTNKVIVPRTTEQSILQQLGLNSLTYSKSGLKKEQNE